MSLTDLKKYLKGLTKEETEQEVINFYKTFKNIKEYYDIKLNKEDELDILKNYKKKILREFFTVSCNYGKADFKKVKEVISNYKKISDNYELIVDLILYSVETAVEFQTVTGEDGDSFMNNIIRLFDDVTRIMAEFGIADEKYLKRCDVIFDTVKKNYSYLEINLLDIYVNNLQDYIFEEDDEDKDKK